MSKLLINEHPLQVLPSLAEKIGLNQAIILQQIHYWFSNNKNGGYVKDGHKWVYNTYEEWQEDNFPFWSTRTIQRIFLKLEEMGLLISEQFEKQIYNHKKFYRINYEKLNEIELETTKKPSRHDKVALSGPTKSRILNKESETTSETNTNSSALPSLLSKEEYAKSKEKHKEYLEGLRKRHPEVALFGINEKRKGVLANLYEYPSDIQDIIKSFCIHWKKVPPPKGSSMYGKWIKDAREIKKGLQNSHLSADEVFDEAYYTWKTPPPNVSRKQYDGSFTVVDLGSVAKIAWDAVGSLLMGNNKRKVKVYYGASGERVER